MDDRRHKLAIVGAGDVGSTIAYACMIRGLAHEIALYDVNARKVDAQAHDLAHGQAFTAPLVLVGGDDPEVCRDADLIVLTAGARQKPGQSRLELAGDNVALCRALVPRLRQAAPQALWLVVSNPVDVLTFAVSRLAGLPRGAVLGSGTVLDSARFRQKIAARLRVAVADVLACIAGEHGDSAFPLWSSASVSGIPLHDWAVAGHGRLSVRDRAEIFQSVREAARHIIDGKGATNYAIGLATASIVASILRDEQRILPVSTPLDPVDGRPEVCLSLPCIVGRRGAETPLPIPMNDNEVAALRHSAEAVRAVIDAAGA